MRTAATSTSIRQLKLQDLPSLLTLSGRAGWNQTAADWALLIRLYPEGCLGIESGGEIVASATLACYGDRMAWLGMVLTHPEHRKRGFATRLVESALNIATDKGMQAVKLDATDLGAPIYQKLGFREEQTIERWMGRGDGTVANPMPSVSSAETLDFRLDREAFGADRSALLRMLAANTACFAGEGGFALSRSGAESAYLGPCIARSPEFARLLIGSAVSRSSVSWFWDLLPANSAAIEIAADFGFRVERRLVRMVKGADIRGLESMIYAAGGFEIG